jgi:hypothetical protein
LEVYTRLANSPITLGWTRLQSPLQYLESYQIQEHARASIIFPLLLYQHVTKEWIKDRVYQAIRREFGVVQYQPEERIVKIFAAIAKSNSLLAYPSVDEDDRKCFDTIVKDARLAFQKLCRAVAQASTRTRRSRISSQPPTRTDSGRITPIPQEIDSGTTTHKADFWESVTRRPNVHIGLHYALDAALYGTPWNSNVLAGEDKHR